MIFFLFVRIDWGIMAPFVKKILFTLLVYHSDAESGKSLTVPLYILSERETGLNEYRKDMHIFCINLRKRRPVLTVLTIRLRENGRSIVGLALFVLYLSVFLFFIPRLFPNRRIKRRCIITGKPLRYYRYRGSIMYGQDTFFAVNLDVCSYIPERGCAKFLNLTHPLRE